MARSPFSPYRPGAMAERSPYGDPFLSLHREMNRLFDDALRGPPGAPGQGGGAQAQAMSPHIDVSETDTDVKIVAELPGVTDKDVEVTLDGDILTIRGEKKFERNEDKENYHIVERSFGTFRRSLQLPFAIEPDRIKADFEHGVLTVTVPKGREPERSRRIQVSTGQSAARSSAQAGAAQSGSSGGGASTSGSSGGGARTQAGSSGGPGGGTGSQGQPDTVQGGTGSSGTGSSGTSSSGSGSAGTGRA